MQTRAATNDDAQHLLRKMLLYRGAEIAASHQWLSEIDRWKELVFALLTQTTRLPQTEVRSVTDDLLALDLLHIPSLVRMLKGKPPAIDFTDPYSHRVVQVLEEQGFSTEEAVLGLTVMCEAAATIAARFCGKIQFYLRGYAERMVDEAQTVFHFSHLDQHKVRYAFSFWIQNVLNMPIPLPDASIESFSKAHGFSTDHMFDAADEMDINVALVDDLLYHFDSVNELRTTNGQNTKRSHPRKKSPSARSK